MFMITVTLIEVNFATMSLINNYIEGTYQNGSL
jgi:hypothetical protein